MSIAPPSDRPEFSDIGEFYQTTLSPFLEANEEARQQAVFQGALVAIATAVIVAAIFKFSLFGGVSAHIGAFAGAGGIGAVGWRINKTRAKIAGGLLGRICSWLGLQHQLKIGRPYFFHEFDRLSLMPSFNREHWEDEIKGQRHGTDFILCEARLKKESGSGRNRRVKTVFHGQLLMIDYHKKFLGETVIKRDRGVFNRFMKPAEGFRQVGLVSSEFEKAFEAWSTDQVEARELLDPVVLERFQELERLFGGANLRAAFTGGKLLVALETGDKINMGSMFTPLAGVGRVEKILKEFDVIFDLIDVLIKRLNAPARNAFSIDAVRDEVA